MADETNDLYKITYKTSDEGGSIVIPLLADAAEKLENAQELKVALGSDNSQSFDGSEAAKSIGVDGVLPVKHGGTGEEDLANITVGKATEAEKVGSTTVGGVATPIYNKDGVLTKIGDGANDVGGDTYPIYLTKDGELKSVANELAKKSELSDGTVTKIGTSDVGTSTGPIYIKAGVPTATGDTLDKDISGNAATATKLATERTLKVNLATDSAQSFDGSAVAESIGVTGVLPASHGGLGSETIGGVNIPIYNKSGTLTHLGDGSADLGSDTYPIYMTKDGVLTKVANELAVKSALTDGSVTKVGTADVGATNAPIYLKAGVPTRIGDGSNTIGGDTYPVYVKADGTLTAVTSELAQKSYVDGLTYLTHDNLEKIIGDASSSNNGLMKSSDYEALVAVVDEALRNENAYANTVALTMDDEYKIKVTLSNVKGDVISTSETIDLPLEEMVIGGKYDKDTKAIYLKIRNTDDEGEDDSWLEIPVGDLIDGLASESDLDSYAKLSASNTFTGKTQTIKNQYPRLVLSNTDSDAANQLFLGIAGSNVWGLGDNINNTVKWLVYANNGDFYDDTTQPIPRVAWNDTGDANTPVYFAKGIPVACTNVATKDDIAGIVFPAYTMTSDSSAHTISLLKDDTVVGSAINLATVIGTASDSSNGLMSVSDYTKLAGLSNYSLPIASKSALGGIMTGYSPTNDREYAVMTDSAGNAYVSVPWVDTDTVYTLTAATKDALGGVKVGYTTSDKNYGVDIDAGGNLYVNVPWTDTTYTLPEATKDVLGGVKVGYTTDSTNKNYAVQINSSNNLYVNVPWTDTTYSNASTSSAGLMSADDKAKLDKIEAEANKYSLPVATDTVLGGVKLGFSTSTTNKNYAVEIDTSNNLYVNVPWTDTVYTLPVAKSDTLGGVKLGFSTSATDRDYAIQIDSSNNLYVNVPWTDTTYSDVSSSASGLMTSALYTKLNGLSINGSSSWSSLSIVAPTSYGTEGQYLTTNDDKNGFTWKTLSAASSSNDGLMTSAMYKKLDELESGATLSPTGSSTNPIYIDGDGNPQKCFPESDTYYLVLGYKASSSSTNSVVIGREASAGDQATTAVGSAAKATGIRSIAIGRSTTARHNGSIAMGCNADVSGEGSIAIGYNAGADGTDEDGNSTANSAIAIGYGTKALYEDSIAIGTGVSTTKKGEVIIGNINLTELKELVDQLIKVGDNAATQLVFEAE